MTETATTGLHSLGRTIVLVDVPNMYFAGRGASKSKLNYARLLKSICESYSVVRAIAYVVHREGLDQQGFFDILKSSGYELRIREQKVRSDGTLAMVSCKMILALDAMRFV
jgi:hypothetical protein